MGQGLISSHTDLSQARRAIEEEAETEKAKIASLNEIVTQTQQHEKEVEHALQARVSPASAASFFIFLALVLHTCRSSCSTCSILFFSVLSLSLSLPDQISPGAAECGEQGARGSGGHACD